MPDQPHTPHIEEVCSAYVQYHHFNSYGMDDSEETEKSFYRMIARIEAAAEQRGAARALRDAAHAWRWSDWADAPRNPVAAANYVGDWVANRADQMEGDDE